MNIGHRCTLPFPHFQLLCSLYNIKSDVSDHVFLPPDHPAPAEFDHNRTHINAIFRAHPFRVAKEGGINTGIPKTQSLAVDPDRTVLEWTHKVFCRVHEAEKIAPMLPALPVCCRNEDL
jgi:hypothetical protein